MKEVARYTEPYLAPHCQSGLLESEGIGGIEVLQ